MNIKNCMNDLINKFKNFSNPILEAEILLCKILNKSKSWLIGFDDYKLSQRQQDLLKKMVYRRLLKEPSAYIIGEKEFFSLNFKVNKKTMIPRPDTEILVEKSLQKIKKYNLKNILDLGTGCGSIAISIAKNFYSCKVLGVDISKEAIKISKINSHKLKVKNVNFLVSNWFEKIKFKNFDIIVSNPPYISYNEFSKIKKELIFEPKLAFLSSDNGLFFIKKIIFFSKFYLNKNGWLFIEHGWMQKFSVQKIFILNNYIHVKTYKDYGNNFRLTVGQKNF
ncbi:peptide chain release factor N(5)-glutamine methyltransferase [Buchnera aphidicola]|uniref:peptide chain release factor N(5)-glutamine methyltransferase n=1 Tax=Buchnera aphidicola TaxID=9 RepID=UPI0030EF3AF3